ncbi:MAG: hypothetical protein NTX85_03265 [Candidatus Nomurabacteria bacterium]|nr:hypothetical protein [Candidatus Nomurabacteria bacterium]MCX6788450.1 hypothetical protein [Candidatus Jorgensenbacteria bacterium]
MRSVYDGVKSLIAIRPVNASAVQTSAAIDTQGYNSAMFVIENGAATGTPTSYTVDAKVQECDTSGGTYVDIPSSAITQIVADNKSAQIRVEALNTGRKRFFKLLITPALTGGTTPKALISGHALLGRAFQNAVSNSSVPA